MASRVLDKARGSRLARNTFWMFLGQGARIPIQALYFILIANSLGATGYGAFVGATALVAILAPFASLGSGDLLVKNVARDPSCFGKQWGKAVALTLASGGGLVGVACLLSQLLLPKAIPLALVLSVALADLIFSRLLDVSGQAFQGFQRLSRTSQLMISANVVRLILVALLAVSGRQGTAEIWGYLYLVGAALSALVALFLVNRELGRPLFDRSTIFSELKQGLYFSVSLSSQNIYNDLDKTMLARLSTLDAAGIYGAAYRIVDVAFSPVRSLLYASYARFFQSGVGGVRGTVALAVRLIPYAGGYGLLVSLALFLCAPLLPYFLGAQYAASVPALRWLCLLPFLKVLHYFAADSLTGAGLQGARSLCQLATAALNIALILWLIPACSWKGAAWASLASDSFLALSMWLVIWRRRHAEGGKGAALSGIGAGAVLKGSGE